MLWRQCALALALVGACSGAVEKKLGLIGADCVNGRDAACASGRCLALDSATAYCTQTCQAASDCPQTFVCAAAPAGGKVCQALGAGGVCSVNDDCPAGLECDGTAQHCYIPVTRSACGACTSDLQCGTGGACHAESSGESFCATPCNADGSCAAGFACKSSGGASRCLPTSGSCRGGRPLCAPCAGDLECGGPGDLCVRNLQSQETFCAVHCTATAQCPTGFSCVDLSGKGAGPQQCVPDSGTCAGYCDAPSTDAAAVERECGLGSACDTANRACKRLTDGSLCAACASDDDCAQAAHPDSRCVQNRTAGSPYQGERFCGSDCSSGTCPGPGCAKDATRCSGQYTCVGIGSAGAWPYQCVPRRGSCASGFGRLGDSCEKTGAPDCLSGICAHFGAENRCSAACTVDGDCGDARWHCCAGVGADKYDCTHPPAGAGQGICAPVGGSFGDDCSAGNSPCQEGLCLDLGTAQLCTRGCDATHLCPGAFSCQSGTLKNADGSLGSAVSVCFPDGGGGTGSSCAFGPAACKSHLCLKKDSGNVCTQTCAASADCPTGWQCAQEAMTDGNRVLVCVPPGISP